MFAGPSLTSHAVAIYRQTVGVDAEGTPLQTYTQVGAFRGGFGSVSTEKANVVGDGGQKADAAISTLGDPGVHVGDKVNTAGRDWKVIGVRATGPYTRILLSAWGTTR